MNNHTQILIAIGASVAANCHPCLEHYLDRAEEAGVLKDEIHEAVNVGKKVTRGAANSMKKFAASALEIRESQGTAGEAACGCSNC